MVTPAPPIESPAPGRRRGVVARRLRLSRQTRLFLAVGACGFTVDVAVFNVLCLVGPVASTNPCVPRSIAVAVALVVAYLGHRRFTWGDRARGNRGAELAGFAAVNACGFALSLACLLVSHSLFGFTGQVSDNAAVILVAPALGGVLRYYGYSRLVFRDRPGPEPAAGPALPAR